MSAIADTGGPAGRAGRHLMPAAVFVVALVTGVLAGFDVLFGLAFGMLVLLLVVGVAVPDSISRLFLGLLAFLIFGYLSFGRSFAYLGVAPAYIGEVALGLGLISTLFMRNRLAAFRAWPIWILCVFMAWGLARTVPYVGTYGMAALRDAVLWGYALFAILVVPIVLRFAIHDQIRSFILRFAPWFLLWAPIGLILTELRLPGPYVPGTEVPVFTLKGGDVGVYLAVIGSFILVGLHYWGTNGKRPALARFEPLWWVIWLGTALVAGSINRGGMVSILCAFAVVLTMRPLANIKRLVYFVLIGAIGISTFVAWDVRLSLGGSREISAEQIMANVASIVADESHGNLSDTREWRLLWWARIVDYTVHGPYFWTGKGFGINLANSDGFQVYEDESLRSPHNGHMSVLARMGVPGFALWLTLQLGFAAMLFYRFAQARSRNEEMWARLHLWILASWTAFVVNASFDVFLEGPQGAIPFWCLFGFGCGVSILYRDHMARTPVAKPAAPGAGLARRFPGRQDLVRPVPLRPRKPFFPSGAAAER